MKESENGLQCVLDSDYVSIYYDHEMQSVIMYSYDCNTSELVNIIQLRLSKHSDVISADILYDEALGIGVK